MSEARYNVLTWDMDTQKFTEQGFMNNPSLNVTWKGLLRALRELRTLGYSCHRVRYTDGCPATATRLCWSSECQAGRGSRGDDVPE